MAGRCRRQAFASGSMPQGWTAPGTSPQREQVERAKRRELSAAEAVELAGKLTAEDEAAQQALTDRMQAQQEELSSLTAALARQEQRQRAKEQLRETEAALAKAAERRASAERALEEAGSRQTEEEAHRREAARLEALLPKYQELEKMWQEEEALGTRLTAEEKELKGKKVLLASLETVRAQLSSGEGIPGRGGAGAGAAGGCPGAGAGAAGRPGRSWGRTYPAMWAAGRSWEGFRQATAGRHRRSRRLLRLIWPRAGYIWTPRQGFLPGRCSPGSPVRYAAPANTRTRRLTQGKRRPRNSWKIWKNRRRQPGKGRWMQAARQGSSGGRLRQRGNPWRRRRRSCCSRYPGRSQR